MLLAACGGGDSSVDEPASLAEELGCSSFEQQDTEELYVRELYSCEENGAATRVYTFNTSSARDSWKEIAEEFGIIVENEGDTWVQVPE